MRAVNGFRSAGWLALLALSACGHGSGGPVGGAGSSHPDEFRVTPEVRAELLALNGSSRDHCLSRIVGLLAQSPSGPNRAAGRLDQSFRLQITDHCQILERKVP